MALHNLTPAPCHNHLWTDEGKVEVRTPSNVAMAQFARLEEMVFANVPICQPAHNIVVVCAIVHLSSEHFSSKQPFKRVDIFTFLYFCINIFCFFIFIANTSAPMSII